MEHHDPRMPEVEFPWESAPETERYVAVDLDVLRVIRELAWVEQVTPTAQPVIRLILRVAHISRDGRVVFGVRIRPLDERPPE
jgi:hypothetical protein